jgi:cobaltochelatase CobN
LGAAQAARLAQARIFGNASGDYGTGLAEAVQSDGLKRDDTRLGELFLQRMSQPYVDGVPVTDVPAAAAVQALGAHLRHTDAAVLSRSSHLYAMVSSDDPFQYLGGLAAAARSAGKAEPLGLYVHQLQDAAAPTSESAARSIALEMQSRYLHPGWLAAQKAEGYAGTLQVLKAVQFAWGWQNAAPDTVRPDHWQSFYEVLVKDRHHLGVQAWLRGANPQAYAQALERLVQAERLGHWQPDAATRRELAQLYRDLTREAPLRNELGGVRRWVEGELPRPVITEPAARAPAAAVQPVPPPPPPVQGVRLVRQPPEPPQPKVAAVDALWRALGLTLAALCFACGMAAQSRRGRPAQPLPRVPMPQAALTAV